MSTIPVAGLAKALIAVTVSLHPAAAHHAQHGYTVRPGDTLSDIARHEYGHASDWPALWWANRHKVPDPGLITVGERLRIPVKHEVRDWVARAAQAAAAPAVNAPVAAPVAAAPTSGAAVTAPAAAPSTATYGGASGSFQQCVIARESGGNAGAVNASTGAGGLYGFLPSTWQALGHSGLPENASVAEQNQAFQQEYAQSGGSAWSAYDGC
jgi:resuscitation-promoting factor RpfC